MCVELVPHTLKLVVWVKKIKRGIHPYSPLGELSSPEIYQSGIADGLVETLLPRLQVVFRKQAEIGVRAGFA